MVHLKFIMFFKCSPIRNSQSRGRCADGLSQNFEPKFFEGGGLRGARQVVIQLWKSRDIFHYQQICVSLLFFNDGKLIIPSSRVCYDSLELEMREKESELGQDWRRWGGGGGH